MYVKLTTVWTRASIDFEWPLSNHPTLNSPNGGINNPDCILRIEEISTDQLTLTRTTYWPETYDYNAWSNKPETLELRQAVRDKFDRSKYDFSVTQELVESLPT